MPKDKSLFFCRPGTGLPIGNLTSQLFGNVYLMDFDSYVKHRLGLQRYSRYVDDFAIVSRQKQFLKCLPALLDIYLKENLKLKLHPRKIKVKHFTDGVDFLGGYIKPGRIYVRNRTKGNFYKTIEKFNRLARDKKGQLNREEVDHFEKSVNSYLGTLGNFNTRKLRKKMMKEVSGYWENYFYYHHRKNKLCRKRR